LKVVVAPTAGDIDVLALTEVEDDTTMAGAVVAVTTDAGGAGLTADRTIVVLPEDTDVMVTTVGVEEATKGTAGTITVVDPGLIVDTTVDRIVVAVDFPLEMIV
jgi:hypothetical protein